MRAAAMSPPAASRLSRRVIFVCSSTQGGYGAALRSRYESVRRDYRPLRTGDGVRPHELNRDSLVRPGELHLRDDRRELRTCILEWDVPDLAALQRVPTEKVVRARRSARADRV